MPREYEQPSVPVPHPEPTPKEPPVPSESPTKRDGWEKNGGGEVWNITGDDDDDGYVTQL